VSFSDELRAGYEAECADAHVFVAEMGELFDRAADLTKRERDLPVDFTQFVGNVADPGPDRLQHHHRSARRLKGGFEPRDREVNAGWLRHTHS